MSELNLDKNIRGNSARKALKDLIELSKVSGYITNYVENYKIGRPGYSDQNQFKTPFLIEFNVNNKWIIFSTTSIRDRVKEQYWEAYNFKELDKNIVKAFLVYPDSINEKEKKSAVSKNLKIQNNGEYSTLDGIISQEELYGLIETEGLKNKSNGQALDAKGNNFEKRIVAILKNKSNLEKWKGINNRDGVNYEIFSKILDVFKLNSETLINIDASCDKKTIGLLPSGGAPKTDVLVTITFSDNTKKLFTISCKRSGNSSVSVHQYAADVFADVLDKENGELRKLLKLFQEKGNKRDMGEENAKKLAEELEPYNKKLALWALGGIGGLGNPEKQWANYILIYNNNDKSISIHTLNNYYDLLIKSNVKGAFGTLFGWTYQGTRGKNIQLTCKILK